MIRAKPLHEILEMTNIANSDCNEILTDLKQQHSKLKSIKNKNKFTNQLLRDTNELTDKILKKRRVIGIVSFIGLILFLSVYCIIRIMK